MTSAAPSWRHLANSAGIHAYPQSHGNLARVGGAMYGLMRDALAEPRAFRRAARDVSAFARRDVEDDACRDADRLRPLVHHRARKPHRQRSR